MPTVLVDIGYVKMGQYSLVIILFRRFGTITKYIYEAIALAEFENLTFTCPPAQACQFQNGQVSAFDVMILYQQTDWIRRV